MKKNTTQITVRMNDKEKKQLDELAIKNGTSINQTILNLVAKDTETNELKTEMLGMKETIIYLNDSVTKQTKAVIDLISALKNKGII
jgi:predicted HicB family RNase H-like nuclease